MPDISTWPPDLFAAKLAEVMKYAVVGIAGLQDDDAAETALHQYAEKVLDELAIFYQRVTCRHLDPKVMAAAADLAASKAFAEWRRVRLMGGAASGGGHA